MRMSYFHFGEFLRNDSLNAIQKNREIQRAEGEKEQQFKQQINRCQRAHKHSSVSRNVCSFW